jgi:hypothetical protein
MNESNQSIYIQSKRVDASPKPSVLSELANSLMEGTVMACLSSGENETIQNNVKYYII